jgi:hypothetical protein
MIMMKYDWLVLGLFKLRCFLILAATLCQIICDLVFFLAICFSFRASLLFNGFFAFIHGALILDRLFFGRNLLITSFSCFGLASAKAVR